MVDFKEFERTAWEDKADRYDNSWGRVSAQAIDEILSVFAPLRGKRLLDIGCGPGRLVARAAELGAIARGCDYSKRMVEIAQANYPVLAFDFGDAEKLPYETASFEAVTLNYLLLHVASQEGAILEAARVLASGGVLVYSLWLPPTESPGLNLMFAPVKEFADLSVIPPAQDIFTFASKERSESFLRANGFSEVVTKEVNTAWDVSSAEEFFSAIQAGSRMGGIVDRQQPEIKAQIAKSIAQRISEFRVGERYIIPTPSLVVSAKK